MLYRSLIKDAIKVSALGYGCMRLPTINGEYGKIDVEAAEALLDEAIASGVNYLDTAWTYHEEASERFVGDYLQRRQDTETYVATKLPMWLCDSHEDYHCFFSQQLERLQRDHVDFYLTHALSAKSFRKMMENDVFSFLDDKKERGQITYAGFSFHDELPVFKEIVDSYNWDFCQIQLNYMDTHYQAGLEGMRYAIEKGLSVIVMEPVKGGKLAKNPPVVTDLFAPLERNYSPAQWALSYVLDIPEVGIVLSGMSNEAQLEENLDVASTITPNSLTDDEHAAIEEVKKYFLSRNQVDCTGCEYCMPCPFDVKIPTVFSYYNNAYIYGAKENFVEDYANLIKEEKGADRCTECGTCESLCPQQLPIIADLKDAHTFFTK